LSLRERVLELIAPRDLFRLEKYCSHALIFRRIGRIHFFESWINIDIMGQCHS